MKHLVLLLMLAAAAFSQTLPLVPGVQVITLTPQPGFNNEPSIAINPVNPQQLVAAWQVNATVAYSRDGGLHWGRAAGLTPLDYRISGDVSVTFDAAGHAILCYIAFDKLGTASYWGHGATRNGIFVRRSLDGGVNWESATPIIAHKSTPDIPFEDKPYIVADNTRSRYRGNLYVGWTQFSLTKSTILFSRSTDGGRTWSAPLEISTHEGLPRDDNGSVEGFTGAVSPDGTLYVVWADGNTITFTSSRDGGRSFAPSRAIIQTAAPYFQVDNVSRANGFPEIAWGPCPSMSGCSPERGVLYITWSDYRNGDVDVFVSTSTNSGRQWSPALRVNSDPLHNGADQFFQWLAVDPIDGAANVIFYDRRADIANQKTTVTLARSKDDGRHWTNFAWTTHPFATEDDFLGDYTGITALNGRVYGVWTEEVVQPAPPASSQTSPAEPKTGEKDETVASKPKHRTIVRLGVADFRNSANNTK